MVIALLMVALALPGLPDVQAQTELVTNPDFEATFNSNNWYAAACTLARTDEDAFQGSWSAKVTNRKKAFGSPNQKVKTVAPNQYYYYTAHVKLLNNGSTGGFMGHTVKCTAHLVYTDGTSKYATLGITPYMRPDRGWVKIGGDFKVANKAVTHARIYLHIPDVSVNYLVDTASLTQVIKNPAWKEDANQRIDSIRKQDLDIRVTTDETSYDPADVEIEVLMHRHHFAFGSAIAGSRITSTTPSSQGYQQVFYDNFEWAVFENIMKWKGMEPNENAIKFGRVDDAMALLRAHDITVRGHCITWANSGYVPDWVKLLEGDPAAIRAALQHRFDYLLKRYEDDLVHWDVHNEQLHHSYFETNTGDRYIMDWMFQEANEQIPGTKLMLNDYAIFSSPFSTMAMVSSAKEMLARGVPVHGIGAQSHLNGVVQPDILNRRIDALSEAGLPIWVTELDIDKLVNRDARADSYETALRMFFSRPEIHGVILWGFWDKRHWKPDAALWEGDPIQPNAAGQRWMDLVKGEWATNEVLKPTSCNETFSARAFQGLYSVNIKVNGSIICHKKAAYDVPVGTDATWDINVEQC